MHRAPAHGSAHRPPTSTPAAHPASGNGLRPDVWERFTHRFGITAIREFYAATEGNAIIFNWDSTPGAVGRIPRWARTLFPVTNIRRARRRSRSATRTW